MTPEPRIEPVDDDDDYCWTCGGTGEIYDDANDDAIPCYDCED